MEALKETTVWANMSKQPNHTYLFDGSKAVGYIKWGKGEPLYFKVPLNIDRRKRTFVKADMKLFSVKVKSELIEVKGSRGDSYWIDPIAKTCTCMGFNFRGTCKHLGAI